MTPFGEGPPGFFRGNRGVERAALLAMALIVAYQTIVPPPVGFADNGDFVRLGGPLGLQAPPVADRSARFFSFLLPGFRVVSPFGGSRYGTSESVPMFFARAAGKILSKSAFVDVRVFGAVNGLFTLAAAAVLLAATRRWRPGARVLLAILLVGVYTDVGYVAAFNSLYSQTAALWSFLFLAGFALLASERPTRVALCGYWISAGLFVTAKPQEVVQAPALAVLGVVLMSGAGELRLRRRSALAAAAALCAVAAAYFLRVPKTVSGPGMHNEVFVEILGSSPDPSSDLRELGLPPAWEVYRGSNPHGPKSPYADPAFREELFRRVGPVRVLGFWARHPGRAAALVRRCLGGSLAMRPPELGNFRESDGMAPGAQSRAFSIWSAIKRRAAGASLGVIPLVILAAAAAGAILAGRRRTAPVRRRGAGLIVLALMAGVEWLLPAFAQGAWGIERVLFGFHAMFDFCLIALALLAAEVLSSAADRFAPRAGTLGEERT